MNDGPKRLPWRLIAPLAGYVLVSLAATWPLTGRLQGWVPGTGDWGQNLWALWWTRQALLVLGQSPFFTRYLFYPEGVSLLFHPLDVSDGLLALPLYGLWGGDAAYNLMVLLSFVLAGYGAYLLALYLTRRPGAGFAAGLVFSLSPYHFLRVDLGHLNLAAIQWLPFFALFLLRHLERGSRRAGLLAVFFLVFTALNSWYYVVYCGLLALAAIFWPAPVAFVTRLGRVGLVLGGAALLLLPLWLPMAQLLRSTALVGAHDPLRHSVDLVSFWLPGPPSTWAGPFEGTWAAYAAGNREPGASAYLGYAALVLAAVGVGRAARPGWWLAVGLGFALLALGPQLQIGGRVLELPLPYGLLAKVVPAFSITGIPGRFIVITSLALAMLAAYGLARLVRKPGLGRYGRLVWVAAALLIGLEYLAVPVRLSSTRMPNFYEAMAGDRQAYAVVDLKWDANFLMHAQTVHGKPLIGGWLARLPARQAAFLEQASLDRIFLQVLLGSAETASDPAAAQQAIRAALAQRQVRYIIVHNEAAGAWVEQFLGWRRVYQQDGVAVYENDL